ncbi:hypothetical protein ACE41H_17765 [Paenibacillus enshidis]|uniref:Mannosyl-glycoprotein endo-beta-N-acetylglucosamidase-like domain-containing protein n=1 Tax=Paenibacillus enshidis TaxID=1458439 RepID=A0ABV5AWM2_9BACL
MPCASNINSFVNGSVTYNGTRYDLLALAKWVSYQSWRKSGGLNGLPVSLIIAQWGFEHSWNAGSVQTSYNFAYQDGTCGFSSGVYDPNNSTPGKRLRFTNMLEGIRSYAKLIIEGYIHVRYAYSGNGGNSAGAAAAANALSVGYWTGYTGPATSYCSSTSYAVNSASTRRLWATAGYNGMDSTITSSNNTCLNTLHYIQKTDPNVYGLTNLY